MDKYFVVMGAQLKCDQGKTNSLFVAINPMWNIDGKFVGRQTDFVPLLNILPFGPNCTLLTAAAGGVTVPCIPFPLPWQGVHTQGQGMLLPVLLNSSTCRCTFGGGISVADAGQNLVSYDGPVAPVPPAPPLPGNIVVYRPEQGITDAETQLNSPATLPANTLFLVNNYLYITDEHGRVVQAKGVLELETAARHTTRQRESVPYKDGQPLTAADKAAHPRMSQRGYWDDGGHIFASQFKGSNLHINYVPMHKRQNQAQTATHNWNAMERAQARAKREGRHVYAEYTFDYPPEETGSQRFGGHEQSLRRDFSMRPEVLRAKTWVQGDPTEVEFFNE